ncbi:ferredoxin [Paractinoplanes globisporus]|uniref:Ferredoxin n=1 Tax=Paractinoplanes globisporus TaxID=113565 RepID=A0ABW6W5N3_9ACTN|nr:ferredoxin [Actinoplanes globisporus]
MKIAVDQDKCCGAGQCAMLVPDVFDQREEDGVVVLLDPAPDDRLLPDVEGAAAVCPAEAIRVER